MDEATTQWSGKFLRVVKSGPWEFVDRLGASGAVAVVAVTPDGKLLLTEQFRIPLNRRVLELPAGLTGDEPSQAQEELTEAAKRELLEETGYAAAELKVLCAGPPSAGLSTEVVAFVLATGLRRVNAGGGVKGEEIQVHEVPVAEVPGWLEKQGGAGLLIDPKIYCGLYFLGRTS